MPDEQITHSVTPYDSRPDTYAHIQRVQQLLHEVAAELLRRAEQHDQSKLVPPEVEAFDEATPKLASLTYGTDEYKASLASLGPALRHHFDANRHHPEHHEEGVDGMNLVDVVEMLCDWKAASERMRGGTKDAHAQQYAKCEVGLAYNQERFGLSDQLTAILGNTLEAMGW